jgi:hypothetical protein
MGNAFLRRITCSLIRAMALHTSSAETLDTVDPTRFTSRRCWRQPADPSTRASCTSNVASFDGCYTAPWAMANNSAGVVELCPRWTLMAP